MKKSSLYTAVLLAALSLSSVFAADTPDPKQQLWQACLGDNQKVTIAVSKIVSVSLHPYLLNGENLITEVTIDTEGNNTLRFYYIHTDEDTPDITDPKSAVRAARKRIRNEISSQPKTENSVASLKFPEGTYAHSIEYQMPSLDDLLELHKSIVSVWETASKKRTTFSTESSD